MIVSSLLLAAVLTVLISAWVVLVLHVANWADSNTRMPFFVVLWIGLLWPTLTVIVFLLRSP